MHSGLLIIIVLFKAISLSRSRCATKFGFFFMNKYCLFKVLSLTRYAFLPLLWQYMNTVTIKRRLYGQKPFKSGEYGGCAHFSVDGFLDDWSAIAGSVVVLQYHSFVSRVPVIEQSMILIDQLLSVAMPIASFAWFQQPVHNPFVAPPHAWCFTRWRPGFFAFWVVDI